MESEHNFGYRVGRFVGMGALYTGVGALSIIWIIVSFAFGVAAILLANWLLATGAELAFDADWWFLGWLLRIAQIGALLSLLLYVGGALITVVGIIGTGIWMALKWALRLPVAVFQRLTGRSLWVVRLTAREFLLLDALTDGGWKPSFRDRTYMGMSDDSVMMIGKKKDYLALNQQLMAGLERMLMTRDFDPENVPVIANTGLKLRFPADRM